MCQIFRCQIMATPHVHLRLHVHGVGRLWFTRTQLILQLILHLFFHWHSLFKMNWVKCFGWLRYFVSTATFFLSRTVLPPDAQDLVYKFLVQPFNSVPTGQGTAPLILAVYVSSGIAQGWSKMVQVSGTHTLIIPNFLSTSPVNIDAGLFRLTLGLRLKGIKAD